ncbi:MAG: hypothetical protein KA243_00980 [Candidatus Aminicenantes bacterium]|nr:hypothetical protein [Candidatus Aminicenantes bacterium]
MSDITPYLSDRVGPLGGRIEELVRRHAALWREAASEARPAVRRYTRADKRAAERELSNLAGALSDEEVRTACLDGSLDAARLEALAAGLKPGLRRLLGIVGLPLDAVYDARFVDATRRFLGAARDFDPSLGLDAAYQALRNVWIMNSLQSDLGRPVVADDAVFAYSMVYPYLDNALDDARAGETGKLDLLAKLRGWLEGDGPAAEAPAEARLLSLVRLIERCFPRPEHPDVYGSLLAIYNAQVRSLLQQSPGAAASAEEVLAISLEKGGASVLADGYLVAGKLAPADEEFCFGFGTFLQLADDLQDLGEDARLRHRTLFTMAKGRSGREAAAVRLENYLAAVVGRARRGATPTRSALCEAIEGGMSLMFRASVGRRPEAFRGRFVRRAKRGFPVRFSYPDKLGRRLESGMPAAGARLADLDPGLVALRALSSRAFALE